MKRTKWVALVAAIAATFAVWQIMSSQMQKQEAQLDYRQVLVAEGGIQKGEVIRSGQLAVRKVPRQYTPASALERAGDATGKVALSAIAPGEIITPERLSNPESGQAGLAYKIPDGNKAITLTVGTEAGVAGMILPGNRVDILVTLPGTAGGTGSGESVPPPGEAPVMTPEGEQAVAPEAQTMMSQNPGSAASTIYLLEDVYVLACGRSMSSDEAARLVTEGGQVMDSITLSMTPEEAKQVELFTYTARQSSGNVRLVLRAAEQKDETPDTESGDPENDIEEQS